MKIDWYRLIPKYWLQNYPTSWEWDALLNDILDTAEVVIPGYHTTTIDGVEIWTENWPYAYGAPYITRLGMSHFLPSVKTRIRLKKFLESKQVDGGIESVRSNWTKV